MFFLHVLELLLDGHLVFRHGLNSTCCCDSVLLMESAGDFDPAFFCIGSPEVCIQVLQQHSRGVLLSAGDSPMLHTVLLPGDVSLFVTDLSMTELSNRLNHLLTDMRRAGRELATCRPFALTQLLHTAHRLTEGSFILLDEQLRLTSDCTSQRDNDYLGPLLLGSSDKAGALRRMLHTDSLPEHPVSFPDADRYLLLFPFTETGGFLLCVGRPDDILYPSVAASVHALCAPLLASQRHRVTGKDLSFQHLFSRIMTESGETDETLMIMLRNLPNPPQKNLRLILIRSEEFPGIEADNTSLPVLESIRQFFPDSHIAVLSGDIVILLSSEIHYCPIEFDRDELEHILMEYHSVAMISNPFTSIMALRVTYRQCHRMFGIALCVKLDGEKRCMSFARYTQYNVIDICAKSVKSVLGGSDIVILCHPGVLTLTRYDRAYGSNLRDVMFSYLMNDRSISRTSAQMFMHRNTTIYKIKKIEELLGESMDDPYLRHNLIFSCLLLRYREQYQKEGVFLSLFERPKRRR